MDPNDKKVEIELIFCNCMIFFDIPYVEDLLAIPSIKLLKQNK